MGMPHVRSFGVPEGHRAEAAQLTARLHAAGWASHVTIERLLQAWDQLAADVADYPDGIDDYTNDLTGRDAIDQALGWASPALEMVLRQRVDAADARFRAVTVEDGGAAVGRYFGVTGRDGWWWRRRPAGGRLGEWLDAAG
jgi:hypothetical protein